MKVALALGLTLVAAVTACAHRQADLVTAPVARGGISETVTASGSLNAQDTILVGSQVSGTISALYVDYNSQVHTGEVLARLDPSTFRAVLAQAQATLAQLQAERSAATSSLASSIDVSSAAVETANSQRAQIAAADENVRKAQAALVLAALTERRDRALLAQGYVAQNVVDADVTNAAAAAAALTAARSDARSARSTSLAYEYQAGSAAAQAGGAQASARAGDAAVRAAAAAVQQAQINLDHATIVSPVDGTVIQRNVSIGQTVAAALQAPTLFTIAKDLTKMELDISVGEPDVGAVRPGQRAAFTVLAYPGRTFTARLDQVRENPTVVNNVTTYDAVAYPANTARLLRPGMTANVQITVSTYPAALIVPLAALQWRPSAAVLQRYHAVTPSAPDRGAGAHSAWGNTGSDNAFAVSVGSRARCYVLQGQSLRSVPVTVLAIDGTRVGVAPASATLSPGDTVVIDAGS
jgi:HlyD family secretion protein